ncbi:MAG: radical SAM protein, partial [Candidatus Omnitrophica bacterium]|nr:radical SAM protein [Candidatus Omnitrophota bacterium]
SNNGSYCIVPYVRGPLRNRNYKDILKELNLAIDRGITRFTLLGQNVNAYEYDGVNFIGLLKLIDSIKDVEEFSFITSHPKDTTPELVKLMQDSRKLKKYLHLPVQSGSNRILELMNRNYTKEFYLELVDNYRRIVREGILTTDIIVGFPTETEDDFLQTMKLIEQVRFNSAYIFKYSPRPYTKAENLPDDVKKEEKEKRHFLLLELQKKISLEYQKYNFYNEASCPISFP